MDLYKKIELQDCPYCGGVGLLEEENGWCFYVACMDCGAHTAQFEYNTPEQRENAAQSAANVWNDGKAIRPTPGE